MLRMRDDGKLTTHPYSKWHGAHWVLSLLADLGYPEGDNFLIPLREQVYNWLFSEKHEKSIGQENAVQLEVSIEIFLVLVKEINH